MDICISEHSQWNLGSKIEGPEISKWVIQFYLLSGERAGRKKSKILWEYSDDNPLFQCRQKSEGTKSVFLHDIQWINIGLDVISFREILIQKPYITDYKDNQYKKFPNSATCRNLF